MNPLNFEEATAELETTTSDKGIKKPSVYLHQSPDGKHCISCWTAPFWQRLLFLFHGKLWLGVVSGKTQPPVWLDMTKTVFEYEKREIVVTEQKPD